MPLDISDVTKAITLAALGLSYHGNFVEHVLFNKSTQTFQFLVSFIQKMFTFTRASTPTYLPLTCTYQRHKKGWESLRWYT